METTTQIALFKGKEIRKIIYEDEWWFSVIDVVEALTESVNARDYWYKMKIRVKDEEKIQLSTFCRQLKLESIDGKKYETDCANTEGIFRITHLKLSHLNAGLLKSAMNVCKKLKIRN